MNIVVDQYVRGLIPALPRVGVGYSLSGSTRRHDGDAPDPSRKQPRSSRRHASAAATSALAVRTLPLRGLQAPAGSCSASSCWSSSARSWRRSCAHSSGSRRQGAREARRDGAARAGRGAVAQHQHAAQPGGREDRGRHRPELRRSSTEAREASPASSPRTAADGRADRRACSAASRSRRRRARTRSRSASSARTRDGPRACVNTITDVYVDHHNKVYRREGLHAFYERSSCAGSRRR